MKKSLHRHTKAELVSVVQDYQEMTSEIEEIINVLLQMDHPIHTLTGLLDIRSAIDRHIFKPDAEPGCVEVNRECDSSQREGHQCA